jgi:hypothetical protein
LKLIREIQQSQKGVKEKPSDVPQIHTRAALDRNKMKVLVHDQKYTSLEHWKAINGKQRGYVSTLIKILEDLKNVGEMVDMDTRVCAFVFFGMVSWAYRWYNPKGSSKPVELAEIFNRIFTKAILSHHPQLDI